MSSKRFKKLPEKTLELPSEMIEKLLPVIKKNCTTKFDESVDLSFQINNKQKKSEINIRTVVNLPGGTGKKIKVAVILNADRMNRAAANALLKSLEEPKGDVCYLLTSARPFNLPKTILSRCQTLLFRDATEKEVTDYHALSLQEQSPWVKSKVLGSLPKSAITN